MTSALRRIAVLGGAGGLGRALVARAVERGDEPLVLDLLASLERHPPPCEAVPIDVTCAASVARAAAALAERWPIIDGFVNLAGHAGPVRPLAETEASSFDDVVAVNLRGAFLATKAVLPRLEGGGSVVLIASGLAQAVRPGFGPYAAAKAGVLAMTKTLALECAPRVRVNAVAPGLVDTAFLRGGTGRSDEARESLVALERYRASVPLGRLARPEDVAGPVEFLLGPASGFMTGQVLWVNGGSYMS